MKSTKVVLFALFAWRLFAGDAAGNGGKVVECKEPSGDTLELLDLFEMGQMQPPMVLHLGDPKLSVKDKVNLALKRLSHLDSERAGKYQAMADAFYPEALFVDGPLQDIQDIGITKIPANCALKQLAIQRPVLAHPKDPRYLIDKTLWSDLAKEDKASLILHEIVYRETYLMGQRDSVRARRFTRYLATETLDKMSQSEYQKLEADIFIQINPPVLDKSKLKFKIHANQILNVPLRSLLVHPITDPIEWAFQHTKPAWLIFDKKAETLAGIPSTQDLGVFSFAIAVKKGNMGSLGTMEITVEQ